MFEEQEEEMERHYSMVPLTLDAIEEVIEKGKHIPKGKVRNIRVRDSYLEEFVFLLLCLGDIYIPEKIELINCEEEYNKFEREKGKAIMKKYGITSAQQLYSIVIYLINDGVVENWKEYSKAESVEDAANIPEIIKNKGAKDKNVRERKFSFIKRFKDKVPEDILLGWSLKEAVILARYGRLLGYFSNSKESELLNIIITKLLKNCHSWKEYGFSYLVGELLTIYQYGKKRIMYGELYEPLNVIEDNLSNGDWRTNPWLRL